MNQLNCNTNVQGFHLMFLNFSVNVNYVVDFDTENILKFGTLSSQLKGPRQTRQTQIRLLLKKQSDQGLPCLPIWQAGW